MAGGGQIFFYDGTSTTLLTDYSGGNFYPQISASGQVVWQGSDYKIFLYDGVETVSLQQVAYPHINISAQSLSMDRSPSADENHIDIEGRPALKIQRTAHLEFLLCHQIGSKATPGLPIASSPYLRLLLNFLPDRPNPIYYVCPLLPGGGALLDAQNILKY